MKKIFLTIVAICCIGLTSQAETVTNINYDKTKPFDYLDLGVTMGTTGLGLELSTHVHDMLRVRTGFSFVPNFDAKMNFGIEGRRQDENGNWVTTKFDSMAEQFQDFTGLEINDIDGLGCLLLVFFQDYFLCIQFSRYKSDHFYRSSKQENVFQL